jgi:type IX secretion system PorP/SprF family membrane protein
MILLLATQTAHAQHFQFSQFYSAPSYLNPAFTGANVCSRLSMNYRNQWSSLPGAFKTYQATFDHTIKQAHSGIGIQFLNDEAGIGSLTTTQINVLYAYEARLNKKFYGRGGVSLGSVQRQIDYSPFLFGDQIAREGATSSIESFGGTSITYFDVGVGILVYGKSTWGGISIAHLNRPNQSMLNGVSLLPAEFKLHGGYKFIIEEMESSNRKIPVNHSVSFAFNYKTQQKFNQIDLGIYYSKHLLTFGMWYRGIPIFKPVKGYENNDAFIVLFGINLSKYKIGYSYDVTLSTLSHLATGGSHELSMAYQFCNFKKPKKKKSGLISCPKF